jgi:hypothetical protein
MRGMVFRTAGAALFGTCALALLLSGAGAADPAPGDEFNALVRQDAKQIADLLGRVEALHMAEKGKAASKERKLLESRASSAVASYAMMIAGNAQKRMGGKNPAEDVRMATLRDAAVLVARAAGSKKFENAFGPAKLLAPDVAAGAKADAKPIDLVVATDADVGVLMHQFRRPNVGGLGLEDEIKANAEKPVMPPADVGLLAARLHAVADYADVMEPAKKFTAATPKRDWLAFTKNMRTAADELLAASRAAKPHEQKLKAAFLKLDASCVGCHKQFK